MNILEGIELSKIYGEGEALVKAVDKVNIGIKKGEFVTIIGASGSGKSTLLHMLGGLDYPSSGRVVINGKDISKLKKDDLSVFRRRNIGFIFQGFNLIPVLSVYENIVLPIKADEKEEDKDFIEEIMRWLGIWEKRDKYPSQLSGGQQQRVAIARALGSRPSIILADEPTGNLDSKNTDEVMNLVSNSAKRYNQTIVLITHNDEIAYRGDRVIRIEDGKIVGGN